MHRSSPMVIKLTAKQQNNQPSLEAQQA